MSAIIALDRPRAASAADLDAIVRQLCLRMPPQWGLGDMVAVNPYVGYADLGLLDAEDLLQRRHHAAVLPGWADLRRGWRDGGFAADDLAAACAEAATAPPMADVIAACLDDDRHASPQPPRVRSIAAVLGDGWQAEIVDLIGRFLAARNDRGVGRWALPAAGGLWADWRRWMRHDRSLAVRGLAGLAAWIAALPADAAAARTALVERLGLATAPPSRWILIGEGVPDLEGIGAGQARVADYLGRLLGEIPGWAGWLRQQAWPAGQDAVGELPELLTIRLALDLALHELHPRGGALPEIPPPADAAVAADRAARLAAVMAWERAFRRGLAGRLRAAPAAAPARPAAQAVFCIDVRSEGFRLALETAAPDVETLGFAGFFAVPVAVPGGDGAERAQCPVLLTPAARIAVDLRRASPLGRLIGSFRRSAAGGFAYMETLGLANALSLAAGALGLGRPPARDDEMRAADIAGIPADQRLALLRGMLANLGLGAQPARLVLLCGHDSTCANNPQAAGLACGACGGHSGAVNARVAARLYNDPALRALLGAQAPPADSVAVAAVHDTATDAVRILDADLVPAGHAADLDRLRAALAAAGAAHRARRARDLTGLDAGDGDPLAALTARSADWAELRPEWGLANNAAFIAAPRAMTAGRDLGGRCFLHSYREDADPDGAVLRLILTAPVVVASWINLQYWASAIDPRRLGSGDKAVHTIVGGIGVAAGSGGDLLPGLAWQSVHDGERPRHAPQRLQVMVAAQPERIDAVVAGHAHLRDLVEHGWIALHAIDPATGGCRRRLPVGAWIAVRSSASG